MPSPSLRRVWVEIGMMATMIMAVGGHPPCGGCGLKYTPLVCKFTKLVVTLLAEGVG